MVTMSSQSYKFDNYNDEVELVDNEKNSGNANTKQWQSKATASAGTSAGGGGGFMRVIFMILVLLVIVLQLVVVGLVGYNVTNGCNCVCGDAAAVQGTDEAPTNGGTTCDTTKIQTDISKIQSGISEIQSNINQVMTVTNGSTRNILQLLQNQQDMNTDFQTNATEMMSNTEDSLEHIINTLSNHKDTSISTSSVVDDILIGVNELLVVHNTSSLYDSITPVSCKMIKDKLPDSPSGYYHVNARDIYCNMDELCGSGGGWTRLAYLDMTDSTTDCPDELQYLTYNGVRMCQRPDSGPPSCSPPVKFPSNGISYTEICGRVYGYEKGTPNGITDHHGPISGHNDLNSYYVDGVSVTKGSPREHVWTFIGGLLDTFYNNYNCPCNDPPGAAQKLQSFVGSNYFCESGNSGNTWSTDVVYTADQLWDGKQCGSQEGECCGVDGPPWFHRQYDNTTTDSLDLRICGDENTANENTPVSFYEIFVK